MNNMRQILCTFGAIILTVVLPALALAQGAADQVELTVNPPTPRPNQDVTVRARNFSIDLDHALIVWTVNGSETARGTGKTEIIVRTGSPGSATRISVSATDQSGTTIAGETVVRPTELDLIWEGSGYVPPFYAGRALAAPEGSVTVTAVPHLVSGSSEIPAKNLVYTWREDGKVLGNSSGYGKNSVTVAAPRTSDPKIVSVEVASSDYRLRAEGGVAIPSVEPRVLFYENDPTLGVLAERALLETYRLPRKEVKIVAYPFFFSTPHPRDTALGYTWTVDGEVVPSGETRNSLTLRQTADGEGRAEIALDIANAGRLLQFTRTALNVTFGSTNER